MPRRLFILPLVVGLCAPVDAGFEAFTAAAPALVQEGSGRRTPRAQKPDATNLAPYVPTPNEVVDRMLAFAKVGPRDVVYDLGCGDGRIVIAAARKYGARGVGVDIDPERIAESRANARKAGVEKLVTFKLQDALKTDVSEATVVTLYLLSFANVQLRPILQRQLKPGARIVSHNFGMGDWDPHEVDTFRDSNGGTRTLYLWRVGD